MELDMRNSKYTIDDFQYFEIIYDVKIEKLPSSNKWLIISPPGKGFLYLGKMDSNSNYLDKVKSYDESNVFRTGEVIPYLQRRFNKL